jgi:major membrane immunogen (membrane-anchored lipoprotein)
MKKSVLLVFSFLVILASSCKKDKNKTSDNVAYKNSYTAWVAFKNQHNNSYAYTVSDISSTGYNTETTITVNNGKVVARDYKRKTKVIDSSDPNQITAQWHEDESTLGTHTDEGAELLTLDEIYSRANTVWLKADPKTNTIYFEVNTNGLLASCGYVPKNCADDCFTGVNIKAIAPL